MVEQLGVQCVSQFLHCSMYWSAGWLRSCEKFQTVSDGSYRRVEGEGGVSQLCHCAGVWRFLYCEKFWTVSCSRCSSVGRELETFTSLKRVLIPWCGKGFFSQSQLSVQTLLRCPHSSVVQSRALTSVRVLKTPSTGSSTFVWTHENTTCTGTNG